MSAIAKKEMIVNVLKESIRKKFQRYSPETKNMPFHYRLLGKDRMALFSFIQSLNTTFGTSIYEPVAIALAEGRFKKAVAQASPSNLISAEAQRQIQIILHELIQANRMPNKDQEIEEIRKACQQGNFIKVRLTKVDIWLEDMEGKLFMIDMKTVKPNIGDFQKYKQTFMEWVAVELAKNPDIDINTILGIPYNPQEPEP